MLITVSRSSHCKIVNLSGPGIIVSLVLMKILIEAFTFTIDIYLVYPLIYIVI